MNFHDQDRQGVVTLSAAKGLSLWAQRCFAALSMTGPVLVVKIHDMTYYQGFTPLLFHAMLWSQASSASAGHANTR